MSPPVSPGGSVLAIVLNPRYVGHVVLDGFGVAPVALTLEDVRDPTRSTSFGTWNLHRLKNPRERARAVGRLVSQIVRRYRPVRAVIGTSRRSTSDLLLMRESALHALKAAGVLATVRCADDGTAMLGVARPERRRELAEFLATTFVPELAPHVDGSPRGVGSRRSRWGDIEFARYHRPAWQAVALAVLDIAERSPLSASALLQTGSELPAAFAALVAAHPNPFDPPS